MRITESRLREIITSVIREHLEERGTNLSSLYHFTDMKGLLGIIQSGLFDLSGWQKDIRGGKNYMSFTRHKSPLEGFAKVNHSFVRIEVFSNVLNSIHDKSIDSYEYYSPKNVEISNRCNPWSNMASDNGDNSAKAAYMKTHGRAGDAYHDSEFLNQAEECLTSDKHFINAERVIKRIDIFINPHNTYSPSYKTEIYNNFSKILDLDFSSLYDKIFIYDNLRDFSLQTDNCIPVSEYSNENLRAALGMDSMVQRPVAEGVDEEGIHIKEKNRGKFTATKERTGKSTEELTHSKNPLTRKRANFARMAKRGWKPLKNKD